jgi:hypothetical protein
VSSLDACVSLRELNLSHNSVADLRGLVQLPALETLDLRGILPLDGCLLKRCGRLRALYTSWGFDVPAEVQVRCSTELTRQGFATRTPSQREENSSALNARRGRALWLFGVDK